MKKIVACSVVLVVFLVVSGYSQGVRDRNSPSPENTPKSDVFMQGFYWNSNPGGIWWDSLASLAPKIGAAGFGAIWFPSPVKGAGGGFSMGYDPYDHYDFGQYNQKGSVETRFGSRQELIRSINAFHAVGMQVFADAVMGHMNGGEQFVPYDCEPYPSYPDSGWLLFNYPNGSGRFKKNAAFFYPNQVTCDVNPPYHGPSDPIYKFGEVPAHTHQSVKDSFIVWGQYLKNTIGFDGWRIDAVKAIDPAFIGPWQQTVGGYAVAEYYGSASEISNWHYWAHTAFGGTVSMFDFPLRFTLQDMCNNTSGTFDMNYLDGAGLVNFGMSGYDVATFVENHDLDRTGWDGSVDNGHNPILTDKDMAYGYTIFSEGRPCVWFRDYFIYGLAPTIDRLIWIREKFLYGSTTKRDGLAPYYVGSAASQADQAKDIYVARRNGGNGRPQSFLVINDHPGEWRGVWVNSNHPNMVFRDYMGVAIDKQAAGDGRVELYAPPRGIAIYVPDTTQHVNRHPYINFIADLSAFTNTPFTFQVSAGDLDNDTLAYSISGNPSWLSMSGTGQLNGTPLPGDTTSSTIVVTASDAWGGSTADTFNITVRSRPVMDGVFEGSGVWGTATYVADTAAGWDGARAREIFVTEDDAYYYFGASVRARQTMNWAFLVNTRPGGGSNESWGRNITYIHSNKPDYVLRGHFQGYSEFHMWNGSGWSGVGTPLASTEYAESITLDSLQDGWVEGRVLKSALGNTPVLQVQLYITGSLNANATFDACPDDQNTTAVTGSPTSLRYYAMFGNKQITECNLQYPQSGVITGTGTFTVYARVFSLGVTDSTGQGSNVVAWIGYNDSNTNPSTWTTWVPATFNVDAGQTDEYKADLGPGLAGGTYYYASRFQYTGGPYLYGGYSTNGGGFWNGTTNISGILGVQAVPGIPSLASPANGALHLAPNLNLTWNAVPGLNTYRLQVATDSLFSALVFDDSTLSSTSRQMSGLAYGTQYYWRVRAKNVYGSGAYSDRRTFSVFMSETINIPVNQNWNTVSVPLTLEDGRKSLVFPSAVSSAYAFNTLGGYVLRDTLVPGAGYWLKFPGGQNIPVTGGQRNSDTLLLQTGWNLVGSISTAIDVSTVLQIPDSIVQSSFYIYNGGYNESDSILPGRAYWVKLSSPGRLVFSEGNMPGTPGAAPGSPQISRTASTLVIEDAEGNRQTLYFGDAGALGINRDMFELPPVPPLGIFDARFESQKMFESLPSDVNAREIPVIVSSPRYPLVLRWRVHGEGMKGVLRIGSTAVVLSQDGEMTISGYQPIALRLQSVQSIPEAYALSQNYPNPFNPTTIIEYALPVDSHVSMKLYNILGQEVMTLVKASVSAGYHRVSLDASTLGAGVYFCRLEAGSFIAVRKLLLLK